MSTAASVVNLVRPTVVTLSV